MKISSHYASFKAIKNPPILQVCRWSLGGHGGSRRYFSTCQSLLHDPWIIWWKFQVIMPLQTCYLTIRNTPVLQVKKLESWRTGWILVSILANQAMSSEYSLKIWSKSAHCGLSYSCFYLSFAWFSAGGGWFCPWGGPILPSLWGILGDGFWKKIFHILIQNFINFFVIYCTFLYKILGLRRFWSYI